MKKILIPKIILLCLISELAYGSFLPDTGQIRCYDNNNELTPCPQPGEAFYGQDAQYSSLPPSYTKLNANGNRLPDSATSWVMVRDNVSGLIWEVKNSQDGTKDLSKPQDADNTYTWYDSNPSTNGGEAGTPGEGSDTEDFIKELNASQFGGFSDWRMPTATELSLIVDRAVESPPFNSTSYFPNTLDQYWTSTTDPTSGHPERCASVNFHDGWMNFPDKSESLYVRAVRGDQAAQSFVDNGDGTVSDTRTGLMWQQQNSARITWEDALAYCENLNLAGYDDWRTPNINELLTLADHSRDMPAIDTDFFAIAREVYYWSSTSNAYISNEAYQVCFFLRGRLEIHDKLHHTDVSYVRAVRGGLNGSSDKGEACPAVLLLGEKDPRLNKIRNFRDTVMTESVTGRKLVKLYYRNAEGIIAIFAEYPLIKRFAKQVLEASIPMLELLWSL